MHNSIPTYLDIKLARTSKIFESEEIMGLSVEQIQEAEKRYYKLLEQIQSKKDIDEGLLSGLVTGATSALIGPLIMKALCNALGINQEGVLGKLLTSKLVLASIGYTIGK